MKFNYVFLLLFMLTGLSMEAQTVSITVTDDGKPMAYHNVTVSHGDYVIGTGQTNSSGFVSIYVPNLRGKSIDVAGKYKNGGTKKEWSIKGKLKLDANNSLHIRLEEMGKEMEKTRKEMDERRKAMSDRMKKRFPSSNNNKTTKPNTNNNNGSQPIKPNTNNGSQPIKPNTNNGSQPIKPNTNNNNGNPKVQPIKPNTNSNSTNNSNFDAKLKEIKNTFSSFDKTDIALDLVKSNNLNTTQIKKVLGEISSSFSKKEVMIAAYNNCTDKGNYETVINTLSSKFMKEDVREATIGN